MKNAPILLLAGLAIAGTPLRAAQPDLSKLPPPSDKKGLTYAKDIRPIFETSCFRCHGEQRQRGELRLDSLEAVLKGGEDGKVIEPGKSKESHLVVAVAQLDEETAMPPKRGPGQGQFRGGPEGPGGGPRGRGGFGGGPGGPGGRGGGFGPGMMLAPQMLAQGDKNGDEKLSKAEFTGLADVWFDKLDAAKTGKLSADQFSERLTEVLPPPPGGGRGAGGPGAGGGRGGFGPGRFLGPGLFDAADTNKDGSLTRLEWKGTFERWFADWDKEKSGALNEEQLRGGLLAALPRPNFGGPGGPGGFGGGRGPGGPEGPGGPGGRGGFGGGGFGPPPQPLTAEQVGLIRAWIDQGAK